MAAGMVPMAHASDGGGSIRIPAALTGLFGFKPTLGRTPSGPVVGESWFGLGAAHAITRSVRDSAALLDATHGPEPGDPYAAPPVERSFLTDTSMLAAADAALLLKQSATLAGKSIPIPPTTS